LENEGIKACDSFAFGVCVDYHAGFIEDSSASLQTNQVQDSLGANQNGM
jgi:hypothetical protein